MNSLIKRFIKIILIWEITAAAQKSVTRNMHRPEMHHEKGQISVSKINLWLKITDFNKTKYRDFDIQFSCSFVFQIFFESRSFSLLFED